MSKKLCSNCGGRQYLTTEALCAKENSQYCDVSLADKPVKSALTSLWTISQNPLNQEEIMPSYEEISERIANPNKKTNITLDPQLLYLSQELNKRKIPHPACPVHSKAKVVSLSHSNYASEANPIKPTPVLPAKTLTVTKATIETRDDDSRVKSSPKSPDCKIQRPTSLILTPQMATATKPNNPHSHTYPKPIRTSEQRSTQHNVPKSVAVSIHPTPTSSTLILCTAAKGNPNTTMTAADRTSATLNHALMSTESLPAEVANATRNLRMNMATNTTDGPRSTPQCPTLSRAASARDPIHKPDAAARPPPARPPRTSSDPGHKPQERPACVVSDKSSGRAPFTEISQTSTPHLVWSTNVPQRTFNHSSTKVDHIVHQSTERQIVSVEIHLIRPRSSKSEPALNVSTASPNGRKPRFSRARLPSSAPATSKSTCNSPLYKNKTLRKSSITVRSSPPTACTSSSTLENHSIVFFSGTNSLPSVEAITNSKEVRCNMSLLVNHRAAHTRTGGINDSGLSNVPKQEHDAKTRSVGASKLKSTIVPKSGSRADKNKFNANLINELSSYEPKEHENSNLSHVAGLQKNISLIKSSSSCLQGCVNTEQQRLAHHQRCIEREQEGHCGAQPPVKQALEMDLHTEKSASGAAVRRANLKLNPTADKQAHPDNFTQTKSTLETTQVNPVIHPSVQPHLETSSASSSRKADVCTHTGPVRPPTSPTRSALHQHPQPGRVEAVTCLDSKLKPCQEDARPAHTHPAEAALLLPPSPQCCKSAALQQRLVTVEANLAANKDRISTLLNIIHDLETCHTPSSRRRCHNSGQDLKSCSTCQKTACIVYSVEYDFRQQERRFLEVLNHTARENCAFSLHLTEPLNFGLLRNLILKRYKKSKVKSKKLYKTLFKWLPRKIQRV